MLEESHTFKDSSGAIHTTTIRWERSRDLADFMTENDVPDYWYLLGRSWFNSDTVRQRRLVRIVLAGYGSHVDVSSGDFNDELERVEHIISADKRFLLSQRQKM